MLKVNKISKSFGEHKVLNDLSIHIEKGMVYTLLGGNGSGKTTLFNLITGYLDADIGDIVFLNKNITKSSPHRINSFGISRTFQDLRLIQSLSVRENILLAFKDNPGEKLLPLIIPGKFSSNHERDFIKRADEVLERVRLSHVADNLAGEISFGQQKLLTIGCCLANNGTLLLLDEPVAGIDKENYLVITDLIKQIKDMGMTILQIEHNESFIQELSDYYIFLSGGDSYQFNSYEEFMSDELVKSEYIS